MRRETGTRQGDQPAIYLNDELPDPIGPPPPAYTTVWTDREYVYGPDYVDELVCQIDRTGAVMYAIQDANYNLMALTDASGAMLEQYTYDPYGTLRVAETYPITHAVNRIGHQGLFYDRLDGTMDDPSLEPNAVGLYYNRNRSYAPHLGRFMQKDPSGTALGMITDLAMLGDDMSLAIIPARPRNQYSDGLSLYGYTRANPIRGRDPSGLFSLAELSGASALSMDLESNNANLAIAALGGIKGLVGFVNFRNLIIADALGSEMYEVDGEGIDAAIGIYESYQKVQSALLVAGLVKAGIALATMGFAAYAHDAYSLYRRTKAVNMPAWKRLTLNWKEILGGHTEAGKRFQQSARDGGTKDLWPSHWDQNQIEKAIKEAYGFHERLKTQGDRVFVRGLGNGVIVEMWVDTKGLIIDSAWSKGNKL